MLMVLFNLLIYVKNIIFFLIIITLALDNIYRTGKQEKFGFKERFSSGLNL